MLNAYFSVPEIVQNDFKQLSQDKSRMVNITLRSEKTPIEKLNEFDIIILGVPEQRNAYKNDGTNLAPDAVRTELYKLFKPFPKIKIADLGNLNIGETINDTYAGLQYAIQEILKAGALPVVIGGSQDLTYAIFKAYSKTRKLIDITIIDSKLDFGQNENIFDSESFLNKIIFEENSNLFNITNIGYQTYLVSQENIELMDKLNFETMRLGMARSQLSETEPILRTTDIVSVDISSVKHIDAPGNEFPSVHGFYGEELCQMAYYAGINDRQTCFGIFEINPKHDLKAQTAQLSAQVIWHFIQGFYLRKNDLPTGRVKKYIVAQQVGEDDIVFFKSLISARWWLEVPSGINKKKKFIASCTHNDYKLATHHEIPARWWRIYHKIN